MAKGRGVKKKSSSSQRRLAWSVFGILVAFSLLVVFGGNMSHTGNVITGNDVIIDGNGNRITVQLCPDGVTQVTDLNNCPSRSSSGSGGEGLFGTGFDPVGFWEPTGVNLDIVRYLMFALVFMLVYWTIDGFVSPEENKSKRSAMLIIGYVFFSGIVAYLAVAFILTNEILALMAPYSALGATFVVIVPFLVVLMFTSKLVGTKYLTIHKVMVQRVVWGAYTLFTVYYIISNPTGTEPAVMNWILVGIAAIALLITLFNRGYIKWIRKLKRRVNEENSRADLAEEKLLARETQHTAELKKLMKARDDALESEKELQEAAEQFMGSEGHWWESEGKRGFS